MSNKEITPPSISYHSSATTGPDDVHVISRNASRTEPAKFLVFLIKNKGAPALVPVK
jgi:hypothetical protein